jgi:ATP synthase assembly factor FMC1, mitochondrial
MAAPYLQPRILSLYRSLLRELPSPTTKRIPIHQSIRSDFQSLSKESASPQHERRIKERIQVGEQFLAYLQAQRQYTSLIERYNPGLNMDTEELVRLTARRVGVNLPEEYVPPGEKKD